MAATRTAPTTGSHPSGIEGDDYADALAEEIEALWNYVGMPLTGVAGTANAIEADSLVPLIADPVQGQRAQFSPTATNTGAVTIDVDGRGAEAIEDAEGNALVGGEIFAGRLTAIEHDGTNWRLVAPIAHAWTVVRKRTDQAKQSDATLGSDTALQFSMAASRTYQIRLKVFFDAPANPDIKYALTGPASPTLVRVERRLRAPGATSYTVASDTAYTSSTNVAGNASTNGYLEIDLIVQNGVNPGTFAFQWAQVTSVAEDVTVRGGSTLEWLLAA